MSGNRRGGSKTPSHVSWDILTEDDFHTLPESIALPDGHSLIAVARFNGGIILRLKGVPGHVAYGQYGHVFSSDQRQMMVRICSNC